jgi:hypothetical protein
LQHRRQNERACYDLSSTADVGTQYRTQHAGASASGRTQVQQQKHNSARTRSARQNPGNLERAVQKNERLFPALLNPERLQYRLAPPPAGLFIARNKTATAELPTEIVRKPVDNLAVDNPSI